MNDRIEKKTEEPVWARQDAFPPATAGWGWIDRKGRSHPCPSIEALATVIQEDRDSNLTLVWVPDHPHLILPEEREELWDSLQAVRARWVLDDLDDATHRLRWFGLVFAGVIGYSIYHGFNHISRLADQPGANIEFQHQLILAVRNALASNTVALTLLVFLMFGFIPWYQARKRKRDLGMWTDDRISTAIPALRFETWLERQNAPITRSILILIGLIALLQIVQSAGSSGIGSLFGLLGTWDGVSEAGLEKKLYFNGDWWRLFTAPFLHGNLVHFLMNASALLYLGKRLEVFARWPHLPLVFLFAAVAGGEASARFVSTPSVGASGGLMGWLGFLLVFETLHKQLVPSRARKRLVAGLALTALIGIVGYHYIDNAAHAGGLLAGMLYAVIVFPASSSPLRPNANTTDRIAGGAAFIALAASAWWAASKLLMP